MPYSRHRRTPREATVSDEGKPEAPPLVIAPAKGLSQRELQRWKDRGHRIRLGGQYPRDLSLGTTPEGKPIPHPKAGDGFLTRKTYDIDDEALLAVLSKHKIAPSGFRDLPSRQRRRLLREAERSTKKLG